MCSAPNVYMFVYTLIGAQIVPLTHRISIGLPHGPNELIVSRSSTSIWRYMHLIIGLLTLNDLYKPVNIMIILRRAHSGRTLYPVLAYLTP